MGVLFFQRKWVVISKVPILETTEVCSTTTLAALGPYSQEVLQPFGRLASSFDTRPAAPATTSPARWIPPSTSGFKMNVDAAISYDSQPCVGGLFETLLVLPWLG
ncbi:hypothetical protein PanWU01x14_135620 [Parasponia andersonii]|uniref:Uncharacterized protein n=1 Tax=Parasponia andersonii TaxID=3476 RepID=A0A2P5CPC9_PARAD|nr:hypothetical protein PanWU01x14_135620 [Parasponia andersonii]